MDDHYTKNISQRRLTIVKKVTKVVDRTKLFLYANALEQKRSGVSKLGAILHQGMGHELLKVPVRHPVKANYQKCQGEKHFQDCGEKCQRDSQNLKKIPRGQFFYLLLPEKMPPWHFFHPPFLKNNPVLQILLA